MTTNIHSFNVPARYSITAGIVALMLLALTIPSFAFAASYAYVNQSGEVSVVVANDPTTAINIAPNRALRSGVMLLSNPSDSSVVGNNVSGT